MIVVKFFEYHLKISGLIEITVEYCQKSLFALAKFTDEAGQFIA